MSESALLGTPELNPSNATAPSGEAGSVAISTIGGKRAGRSRAKVIEQRERFAQLGKPVVRRHIMKDLTKVIRPVCRICHACLCIGNINKTHPRSTSSVPAADRFSMSQTPNTMSRPPGPKCSHDVQQTFQYFSLHIMIALAADMQPPAFEQALLFPIVLNNEKISLVIYECQEEIQAMVDLAYWSEFDTSRRDAASAFATLSMNGTRGHTILSLYPRCVFPVSIAPCD